MIAAIAWIMLGCATIVGAWLMYVDFHQVATVTYEAAKRIPVTGRIVMSIDTASSARWKMALGLLGLGISFIILGSVLASRSM